MSITELLSESVAVRTLSILAKVLDRVFSRDKIKKRKPGYPAKSNTKAGKIIARDRATIETLYTA